MLILTHGTGKGKIKWNTPGQIFVSSFNGDSITQLTDDNYSVGGWTINEVTGTLIVSGYFDTNQNGKKGQNEKSELLIFDLKTLKVKYGM